MPKTTMARNDVFGVTAALKKTLKKQGDVSVQNLRTSLALPQFPETVSIKAEKASYFAAFQKHDFFQLNKEEKERYNKNGFVVSERLGAESFGEIYYRIYATDLPVLITADSMLHAFHWSFDRILKELEKNHLFSILEDILEGIHKKIESAFKKYGKGTYLEEAFRDVDLFVTVARNLLLVKLSDYPTPRKKDGAAPPNDKPIEPKLAKMSDVENLLAIVTKAKPGSVTIFGLDRSLDGSQFIPRGNYMKAAKLRAYFRTMMWLAKVDFRIAGGAGGGNADHASQPKELAAVVILAFLLDRSKQASKLSQVNDFLNNLVGPPDCMTFVQLQSLLDAAGIKSLSEVNTEEAIVALQSKILESDIGVEAVRSRPYWSPMGPGKLEMPRSLAFMSQRFTLDAWAMSHFITDNVKFEKKKIARRVASGADIAYSVLGNKIAGEVVADRIEGKNPEEDKTKFRDGLPFQNNLSAIKTLIDSLDEITWNGSVYSSWIACLRELSAPQLTKSTPQAATTKAWAYRTLNTQLASWTQLRHDTILFVKEPYTDMTLCEYPDGYVDPCPNFWSKFALLLGRVSHFISNIKLCRGTVDAEYGWQSSVASKTWRKGVVEFLKGFADKVEHLHAISVKQDKQERLNTDDETFLKDVMMESGGSGGTRYEGWYPVSCFYGNQFAAGMEDNIVTGVMTNVPDPVLQDPGCVLHEGVGGVNLMLAAIDNGNSLTCYAGPVFSYYEFQTEFGDHMTDEAWDAKVKKKDILPAPYWATSSFLVPSATTVAHPALTPVRMKASFLL